MLVVVAHVSHPMRVVIESVQERTEDAVRPWYFERTLYQGAVVSDGQKYGFTVKRIIHLGNVTRIHERGNPFWEAGSTVVT
jgi:hypothetical protein